MYQKKKRNNLTRKQHSKTKLKSSLRKSSKKIKSKLKSKSKSRKISLKSPKRVQFKPNKIIEFHKSDTVDSLLINKSNI